MPVLPKRIVQQLPAYPAPAEGRYHCVRLDFNENTSGFPEAYPDSLPPVMVSAYPEYGQLIKQMAEHFHVPAEYLLLTNGSDEGLFLTAQTFIEPGEDRAVVSAPCFVVIPHCLKLAGAEVHAVPVRSDLSFDVAGIEAVLKRGVKLAMFATPDNPTGSVLEPKTVRQWCTGYPNTLFAIDEAYGEFTDDSMLEDVLKFDNLLVYRTFSKAWGMAGLRLGVLFGHPELLKCINVMKLPYSVNAAAVWTAGNLLQQQQAVEQAIEQIKSEKERLCSELTSRGFRIDRGHANSLLLHVGINAQKCADFCRSKGVLLRNRSGSHFPEPDAPLDKSATWGRVRVSMGTPAETDALLETLDTFIQTYGVMFDLDGTIVDVSTTYDALLHQLVEEYSGAPLSAEELRLLRAEGGYNDDWTAIKEILRRRGIAKEIDEIAQQGFQRYMSTAKGNEPLLCSLNALERLGSRYPLVLITGRSRPEYEPLWHEELSRLFRGVYCLYDLEDKQGKPSPDYLLHAMAELGLSGGVYIGNAVDDMMAARAAGLDAIGITTTHPPEVLLRAGAMFTVESVERLLGLFMV